ncbi:MAG: sensor histidine kinase, partial [Bacteroidetes bacterium]
MSLRRKFVLYLLFLHGVFAAVAVALLWNNRLWLIAVEAFFVLSFLIALRLFRAIFRPLELLAMGVDVMKDQDFSTRLRTVGQPEMDPLIEVYNRMADHLRQERIRLQEQQFFLEKVLNVSPSAIIMLDYDARISYVNPAAESLLSMEVSQLNGKRFDEINSQVLHTLAGLPIGDSVVIPLRGVRKIKCYKSSFVDRGFQRTFFLIEELTEELRRTEKAAYDKLIRMLSHEVNNSIGAANSLLHSCLHYKEQLREEDKTDFQTAISVAISRTEHLNSFMKSFADIVKLPLPHRERADIRELVEQTVALMKAELDQRNITVRWELNHEPKSILMDRHQIEQVLLNILKNAMEAIKTNGTITIRLEHAGNRTLLSIEDTGGGISSDVRQHLFTPFYSTKEHGQGIGLTLVQEILSNHKFEFS